MATTLRTGLTGPGSYWEVSRAPRYSLVFALPLLLLYQILATLEPAGRQGRLRGTVFALMLAESTALALGFGIAVAALTSQFVRPPVMIGPAQVDTLDW